MAYNRTELGNSGPLKRDHNLSLLSFPRIVREQIYRECGLINSNIINIGRDGPTSRRLTHNKGSSCSNLSLTCRDIDTEISKLLYSNRLLTIRLEAPGDLHALQSFRPSTLSSFTYLCIWLKSPHLPVVYYRGPHIDETKSDPPRNWQAILEEWQKTLDYVLAHVKHSTLRLMLSYDVPDLQTGVQVVAPLLGTQSLANCAVLFSRRYNFELEALARVTCRRAMGQRIQTASFHFLDLPPEIRFRILQYTDLVLDAGWVQWTPRGHYVATGAKSSCSGVQKGLEERLHTLTKTYSRCLTTFCHRSSAAYYSECSCWKPPTALFLISHQLRRDAQAVFFRRNRFVVEPSRIGTTHARNITDGSEICRFFREVAVGSFLYLRRLDIAIMQTRTDDPIWNDWLDVINIMKDELCLSVLRLGLHFTDECGLLANDIQYTLMEVDQESESIETYREFL